LNTLKERNSIEINQLIEEIKKLHDQIEENRDQDQLKKCRREIDA